MEDTGIDIPDDIKAVHSSRPEHEDVDAGAARDLRPSIDIDVDAVSETSSASKESDVPRSFVGAFVAEAAKGNLILFSAILSGFGIFFTKRVFWLTFGIIAYEAYIGILLPYRVPGLSERWLGLAQQFVAPLRAGKFLFLGIPLLSILINNEVSDSRPELCNEVCRRRARLALFLGLGSLLVLETLPPMLKDAYLFQQYFYQQTGLITGGRTTSKPRAIVFLEFVWKGLMALADIDSIDLNDLWLISALFLSLVCSAVSVCITGIVLLIIGGSYAVFMGWQSFLLCWAVLVTEAMVEGVLRAERLPHWLETRKLFLGAALRFSVHVIAFGFLISKYKHLRYATPALDIGLCDATCQNRLQDMLTGLKILTCIQWIVAFEVIYYSVHYRTTDSGEISRRMFHSGRMHDHTHFEEQGSFRHRDADPQLRDMPSDNQSSSTSADGAARVNMGTQPVAVVPCVSPREPMEAGALSPIALATGHGTALSPIALAAGAGADLSPTAQATGDGSALSSIAPETGDGSAPGPENGNAMEIAHVLEMAPLNTIQPESSQDGAEQSASVV